MEADASTQVIDMINTKISPFDQKISHFDYGLNNSEFIVFFSSAQTSISKLQNFYNEVELNFFKLILMKILDSEDLNIKPRDALNLSSHIDDKKINKLRAQNLLENWITATYFHQHTDNLIYLGAKTLTEFKELLQKMELAHCRTCLLCENIAIWVSFDGDFIIF
jgi:Nse1 non-SMC component of SMC5-6 complex